jgi:hypothetical protein
VQDEAGHHLRTDGMKPELECGDHAEAATASTQCPEELPVLVLGGPDQLALGGHQLCCHQVVAREAVLAFEPAGAAAQGEPAHPGRGHAPAGGGEPVDLRDPVDVSPGGPPADARHALFGVDVDVAHAAQIEHEAVVAE